MAIQVSGWFVMVLLLRVQPPCHNRGSCSGTRGLHRERFRLLHSPSLVAIFFGGGTVSAIWQLISPFCDWLMKIWVGIALCCNALWDHMTGGYFHRFLRPLTVPLHNTNGRQMPVARAVQRDCETVFSKCGLVFSQASPQSRNQGGGSPLTHSLSKMPAAIQWRHAQKIADLINRVRSNPHGQVFGCFFFFLLCAEEEVTTEVTFISA